MKKKQIIAICLAVCLLGSTAVVLAQLGVFLPRQIAVGTEAAKLLLANERLDDRLLSQKMDIGLPDGVNTLFSTMGLSNPIQLSATAGTAQRNANTAAPRNAYTWSSFPQYSASMVEFTQFVNSVEHEVSRVAEDIAHMKDKVGITDKWVAVGREWHLLQVFETYDVLMVLGIYDDIHVYYRYTDENAKNVYEMFSFMAYDDGTTGEIRTMLIPGERYEYMYENSNGFIDYFIAENSRGYWMNTRFGLTPQSDGSYTASFSPYIIKDGLGFGVHLGMDSTGLEPIWCTVFDPQSNRELLRFADTYNRYDFSLYFSAIRNGLVSVSATDTQVDSSAGVTTTNSLSTLTTKNGSYTAKDPTQGFSFTSGHVQYLYGDNIYCGAVDFSALGEQFSFEEACHAFFQYTEELGLSLYCSENAVVSSLTHAKLLADTFGDSFQWNGYQANSIDAMLAAKGILKEQYDDARADYEAVKDAEQVKSRQALASDAHFAAMQIAASGSNRFAGNVLSLAGLSAFTEDVTLFEAGEAYVLKVGLALVDQNGNPISVNTVPLSGATPTEVVFEGQSISLLLEGEYTLPSKLDAGRYAAVVYIATRDEGIRVSEMVKIAFVSIEAGEVTSAEMSVLAEESGEHLLVTYAIRNLHQITMTATKPTYTPEEIKRLLTIEILTYGAPYRGAVLEYANGEAVAEDAVLGVGTYRMVGYLATETGLVQSYVYLTISE